MPDNGLTHEILDRGYAVRHREPGPLYPDRRTYTVGLSLRGQPELIVSGLPPKHAERLLAHIVAAGAVARGDCTPALAGFQSITLIDAEVGLLPDALHTFGVQIEALQVVWDPTEAARLEDLEQALHPRGFLSANDPYPPTGSHRSQPTEAPHFDPEVRLVTVQSQAELTADRPVTETLAGRSVEGTDSSLVELRTHATFIPLGPRDIVRVDDGGQVQGIAHVEPLFSLEIYFHLPKDATFGMTPTKDHPAVMAIDCLVSQWRTDALVTHQGFVLRISSPSHHWLSDNVLSHPFVAFHELIRTPSSQVNWPWPTPNRSTGR